jgi:choline dehydrogenase-like flavoprotein
VTITDTRDAQALTDFQTDTCIVGAGAAGITLAAELARGSQEVCLIESGGLAPDPDTQALYDLESVGYPLRANYMSRARYFGGSCNLWAGRSMTLSELDFETRSWVPHSGWPISQRDVTEWLPRAADILGVPLASQYTSGLFEKRASVDEKRLFGGTFVPTYSLWARSAKRFGSSYRSELARSGKARVLLNASVTHINLTPDGHDVESLTLAAPGGRQFKIRARRYVLACGGLENARLLLASRDRQPNGVGNEHDAVGRYFMDHPRAVFGKVHVEAGRKLTLLRGRPLPGGKLQLGVGLSAGTQRSEELLNHYLTLELQSSGYTEAKYQTFVQTMKVAMRRGHAGSRWKFARENFENLPNMMYLLSPKELMPHPLYRLYVAARDAIPRKPVPKTFVVVYFCEQPPTPDSRVTLSNERDALGVQRLRLDWRIGSEVGASIMRMQRLLAEGVARTGLGRVEPGEGEPAYTDASHHMGTTRMSVDPRHGVVDVNCKVHGVNNLYMAGSSVFPCAGHANPTLTIVALSLRLARHLAPHLSRDA